MDSVMETSGSGIPAPYGKACMNCAKAKCKCILRSVPGACERCHRLRKDCQPANATRKRPKKPSSTSRTAKLEEKLEDLVFLLRTSRANDPNGVTQDVIINTPNSSALFTSTAGPRENSTSRSMPSLPTPESSSHLTGSPAPSASEEWEPSVDEAQLLLDDFRTSKLKWFPFVSLPETTSAQQLRRDRPFLWMCIMAVSTRTTSRQISMANRIRQTVAQKMIVEQDRSIDLLLGILTYLGWANYQIGTKPFMGLYSQLAIALVHDLGLNRQPDDLGTGMLYWKNHSCVQPKLDSRTMEHRRAVVSTFLITSDIASFLQKMDCLVWTSHMEECLVHLEQRQEIPEDRLLVALVRLQMIEQETFRISLRSEGQPADAAKTPAILYAKAMQQRLQQTVIGLSLESSANECVAAALKGAQLSVTEIGFSRDGTLPHDIPDMQRVDILYSCLKSVKSWFDYFFAIPPSKYPQLPFFVFRQVSHSAISLYRLTVLDDPIWDRASVSSTIDLIDTMNQIADRLSRVGVEAGLVSDAAEGNVFEKSVKTIRAMGNVWEAAMMRKGIVVTGMPAPPAGTGMEGLEGMELGGFPANMDTRWFTDIWTPFDF